MVRKTLLFISLGLALFWLSQSEFLRSLSPGTPQIKTIRVGVLAPLSGPLAEYGIAIRNGISLALEQRETSSVKVVFEDTEYDSKKAVSAFNRLRMQGIDLVYNFGGPTSEVLAPIAERYHIPLLVWSADSAVAKDRSFVIRFINPAKDFAIPLVKTFKQNKVKRIGIIKTENQYLNSMLDGLRASLEPGQALEVIDNYMPSDSDFRASISKIPGKKYDALGVYLLSGQVAQFYRQLAQQHVTIPTFGTDFFESRSEIEKAGEGINGAYFTNHGVTEAFRARYIERFGNDYQLPNAALGFDLIELISALPAQGSKEILDGLRSSGQHLGVSGEFYYQAEAGKDPHFSFPIELKKIQDDELISLAKF